MKLEYYCQDQCEAPKKNYYFIKLHSLDLQLSFINTRADQLVGQKIGIQTPDQFSLVIISPVPENYIELADNLGFSMTHVIRSC